MSQNIKCSLKTKLWLKYCVLYWKENKGTTCFQGISSESIAKTGVEYERLAFSVMQRKIYKNYTK